MNQASSNPMEENRMNQPMQEKGVEQQGLNESIQPEKGNDMGQQRGNMPVSSAQNNSQDRSRQYINIPRQEFGKSQGMQPGQGMQPAQNMQPVPPTKSQECSKSPAGFWIRLAAYFIDTLLTTLIIGMINLPIGILRLSMGDSMIFHNILFGFDIFDILNYLLVTAYFIVMTYTTGRTVGKMLMKIRVKSVDGKDLTLWQVIFREVVGKYLSHIFYIGYLMIGLADNKRGLHDRLADTQVVYEVK